MIIQKANLIIPHRDSKISLLYSKVLLENRVIEH